MGVSFASAGSGYDELTTLLSGVIPMSEQPGYLKEYIERVESIVGEKEGALRIVSNALVIISAGTNDFIFNFYDLPTPRIEFSIDVYQDFALRKLQNVVKEIYRIGGRKMMVTGLPPIGCLPIQRKMKSRVERSCSEEENEDAQSYNHKLQKMVQQMERELYNHKLPTQIWICGDRKRVHELWKLDHYAIP